MVPLPRSQHICNCIYTCQRVLCLLTWRHQQRVASHCFSKLWLWGEFTGPISSVHGSFGEHLGRPKIAHGSHNDVRRLCWPNFRDIHGLQLVWYYTDRRGGGGANDKGGWAGCVFFCVYLTVWRALIIIWPNTEFGREGGTSTGEVSFLINGTRPL